jgi:hypothetical protein
VTKLYVLAATKDGWTLHSGPYRMEEATDVIDRHLAPNGWAPALVPLTRPDEVLRHFTAAGRARPQPVEGADLFVALRRAILCDSRFDGADCDRGGTLVAHLEAHRPIVIVQGDEDCLYGDCDHDRQDGRCDLEPVARLCAACTAVYDSGSEYGPEWLDGCRIEWPCQVVRSVAQHYKVPLDEWEKPT